VKTAIWLGGSDSPDRRVLQAEQAAVSRSTVDVTAERHVGDPAPVLAPPHRLMICSARSLHV
jgi:hypothetical protein